MEINDIVAHYSNKKIILDKRIYEQGTWMKPCGLWITIDGDDDWKQWCLQAEFREDYLKVKNEFKIVKTDKILLLETEIKFKMFTKLYVNENNSMCIDWEKVASDYDGIIIPIYFYQYRLDNAYMWYYGWDCVTGCIWNTSIMKEL